MRDLVVLINLDGAACRSMARKLRAEHIYCKILPADATDEMVHAQEALGILLPGGAKGEAPDIPHLDRLLAAGLPVLGMGDAALTLCQFLGGMLGEKAADPQVLQVHYDHDDPVFTQVEDGERYLAVPRTITPPEKTEVVARAEAGILGFRLSMLSKMTLTGCRCLSTSAKMCADARCGGQTRHLWTMPGGKLSVWRTGGMRCAPFPEAWTAACVP